eukprot:8830342-Alexandrium_andersonii.AAC.1
MSASLVGSEMCIRDSRTGLRRNKRRRLQLQTNSCGKGSARRTGGSKLSDKRTTRTAAEKFT